ncbi:MAG: cupredoxin domain-containing protein [Chloroflexota bacterium]
MSTLGTISEPGQGHSRKAQNIAARRAAERKARRMRVAGFLAAAVIILGGGLYLAFSGFLGQRGATTVAGAITMRSSMAGFDPNVLRAKPGETLTIDWWNLDNSMHLDGGGVHTFIAPELGIYETLPAEARRTIQVTAPLTAGSYDFYCDTCCGGKESPTMHGTLVVEV